MNKVHLHQGKGLHAEPSCSLEQKSQQAEGQRDAETLMTSDQECRIVILLGNAPVMRLAYSKFVSLLRLNIKTVRSIAKKEGPISHIWICFIR